MNSVKKLEDIEQEDVFKDVIIVDDVDFLAREQTREIILRCKQAVKDLNKPEKWITWDEYCKMLDVECFID